MCQGKRFLTFITGLYCSVLGSAPVAQPVIFTESVMTIPERTDYARTSTHAEVLGVIEALVSQSEFVHEETLLTTTDGKCMGFLFGSAREKYYLWAYMGLITLGAVASMDAIINLFDGVYATMAIPTMLSALWLSPKVRMAAKDYFARLDAGAFYTANPVSSKAAVSED